MADAQNTIMFQGTAICVFSHEETADFAFDAAQSRVTRSTGDFSTLYTAGQFFRADGAAANRRNCFQIIEVAPLYMVLDVAPADELAASMTLRVFDPAANITSLNGPSRTNPRVDVSHSLSPARDYKLGLQDNGSFSFDGNTVRGDEGYRTLLGLQESRANALYLVAAGDRAGFKEFLGGVEELSESGQLDGAVTFTASIFISGAIVNSETLGA